MKIGFVGGGSGGHFYPIIAVAQKIQEYVHREKLLEPQLYYFAPHIYDKKALFDNNIKFIPISAGKLRRYHSIKNFFDLFKTLWGVIKAFWRVLVIFPDIIFSTGSYTSFPVLLAARLLRIPVIIHESDAFPGRANAWAAKFAKKISVSFSEALAPIQKIVGNRKKDDGDIIAVIGQPIRKELLTSVDRGAHEYLHLEKNISVLLVLGGSQGAQVLNETIIDTFPELLQHYQVLHQTGPDNLEETKKLAGVYLEQSDYKERYKPFGFLNILALRMAAGAADLIISRAGASAIFEIAAWGKPSIIVPISGEVSHNQRNNAFAYARAGTTNVIEEHNLTPNILVSEINRLLSDKAKLASMEKATKNFAKPDAADKIAREILELALQHEK